MQSWHQQHGQVMNPRDLHALNARLDILGMSLVELARSIPAEEAWRAAESIRMRVYGRIQQAPLCDGADVAGAADLAQILAALVRH
jgi:hypothetical protein